MYTLNTFLADVANKNPVALGLCIIGNSIENGSLSEGLNKSLKEAREGSREDKVIFDNFNEYGQGSVFTATRKYFEVIDSKVIKDSVLYKQISTASKDILLLAYSKADNDLDTIMTLSLLAETISAEDYETDTVFLSSLKEIRQSLF